MWHLEPALIVVPVQKLRNSVPSPLLLPIYFLSRFHIRPSYSKCFFIENICFHPNFFSSSYPSISKWVLWYLYLFSLRRASTVIITLNTFPVGFTIFTSAQIPKGASSYNKAFLRLDLTGPRLCCEKYS